MTSEKPTFGATIEPRSPEPTHPRLQINSAPFGDEKTPLPTIDSASTTSTPTLTPVVSHNDLSSSPPAADSQHNNNNPFSAFYAHPPSRTSLEQLNSSRNASRQNLHLGPSNGSGIVNENTHSNHSQHDLEKGLRPTSLTNLSGSIGPRPSTDRLNYHHDSSTAWPTKQSLKAKARAMKLERRLQRSGRGCCGSCVELRERCRLKGRMKLWVKILLGLLIVAAAVGIGIGVSRAVGGGVWAKHGTTQIGAH
ncbi:hypothetical protein EV356DRAFT_515377 [Viridothelium virens]|uniref:Uncharacterized protein n=1 Tax=Viridothelium virens TaxID=1048519 RepID=A0A6A6HNN1_VIRVR|nr:hypothetical protein EV356DRAFT_515377 [Viridothelium virens]